VTWKFQTCAQSYYGGLLCCAWSPDGRHLAAGGEDDLVALYSVADRETVAWGEAHGSWVSAIAFDPWCATPGANEVSGRVRMLVGMFSTNGGALLAGKCTTDPTAASRSHSRCDQPRDASAILSSAVCDPA